MKAPSQKEDEKVIDYQYIRNLKNKEVRKTRFKRTLSQRILHFILLILLTGELLYLGGHGFQILRNSDVFILRDVEVTGIKKTSPEEIEALVFASQKNTLKVDLKQIKLRLESHPWIQSAILWRELPGTIRVHILERKPVAIVSTGNLYLVDSDGHVIQTLEKSSEFSSLPVITGITEISNEVQIRASLNFVETVSRDPVIFQQVSEFHYYDNHNTILYLKGYSFGLLVSKDDILPMIKKFADYSTFMKDHFSNQKLIDLRYEGQIIVKDGYKEQL
ncbi:FtsQ-type POTRA domain-containing protein [bacterium]|nr:FtsQ-type POTRA domain-containing protein [bacterium]